MLAVSSRILVAVGVLILLPLAIWTISTTNNNSLAISGINLSMAQIARDVAAGNKDRYSATDALTDRESARSARVVITDQMEVLARRTAESLSDHETRIRKLEGRGR